MPALGIICGMQAEADALGRLILDPRVTVSISGARPDLAEEGARWCLAQGCRGFLSFGLAGGLDPALPPGTRLTAAEVSDPSGQVTPLAEVPGQARDCAGGDLLLGSDTMVLEATEKARLHARTGAIAVDMETHRVARIAAAAGVPAFALRVIGDPASQSLPPFVADALSETGHPKILPVLAGLARAPGWLPDLLRLRRTTNQGLETLAETVRAGAVERILDQITREDRGG